MVYDGDVKSTRNSTTGLEDSLADDLAALGYPGFSYLKLQHATRTPAELLLAALAQENLDSRLIEALPWLVWTYPNLDWQQLIDAARTNQLQNRLGFVISVARRVAEQRGEAAKVIMLAQAEAQLEASRLSQEDTLCHASLTQAERIWLRQHRSQPAAHWRLLTDLSAEHLDYAA